MSQFQHFLVETEAGVTILQFVDPNLTANAIVMELDDELERFVRQERPSMLLISFERVERSSTAVINSLLRILRRLDAHGCRLMLCGMNENVRSEFEMLQLDGSIFEIHDSRAGAIQRFLEDPDDKYQHFKVQCRADVFIVHLLDPRLFDNLTVYELDDELERFLEERNPPKLLVNFGGVSRCSTAVINSLLRARSRMLTEGGSIRLCGMNEHIRGEFSMLELENTVFKIHDSASDAISSFE